MYTSVQVGGGGGGKLNPRAFKAEGSVVREVRVRRRTVRRDGQASCLGTPKRRQTANLLLHFAPELFMRHQDYRPGEPRLSYYRAYRFATDRARLMTTRKKKKKNEGKNEKKRRAEKGRLESVALA